jgi:hypothetical protein
LERVWPISAGISSPVNRRGIANFLDAEVRGLRSLALNKTPATNHR